MSEEDIQPEGPEEEADLAAAEHVLGLADARARALAAERLRGDAAFARDVAAWEDAFAPLLDEVAPAQPSAELWRRIAAATAPEAAPPRLAPAPVRRRPRDRAGPWRAATAASLAAAGAMLAMLLWRPAPAPVPPPPAPPPPLLEATLAAPDGRALYVATLDRARRLASVAPVGAPPGAGHVPELWIIPAGGRPRAIGVIDARHARAVPLPPAAATDAAGASVLAVSLEPPGGSPTGAPTGPVVAVGALSAL